MRVCVCVHELSLPIGHKTDMCSKQLALKISQERWLNFRYKFDHPIWLFHFLNSPKNDCTLFFLLTSQPIMSMPSSSSTSGPHDFISTSK